LLEGSSDYESCRGHHSWVGLSFYNFIRNGQGEKG
jgi:hypothetical protein